jgi:Holliday junction resolvasome RuvABC DNA-binding subunit
MLTRTERLAMVKGIGQKTAHNVFTAAKHMVELWEKERTDIQEAA